MSTLTPMHGNIARRTWGKIPIADWSLASIEEMARRFSALAVLDVRLILTTRVATAHGARKKAVGVMPHLVKMAAAEPSASMAE